ncbi:MAG TPA: NifU family protein [Pyrinomonadaceae bacterium]|nr:NifU family protein [Pyrinomonadaceae bacterium]
MTQSIEKIEELVERIESLPDPEARASSLALVQALMDFHGEALDRLMEIVAAQGEPGYAIFDKFSSDELVSNLLLLYSLHPLPIETRVLQALENVKPHLDSHGGSVELLEINNGVVRLRLQGTCKGCPSSADTLKLAIEAAIFAAAPDVVSIEAEGVIETKSSAGFVQIAKAAGNGNYSIANCQLPDSSKMPAA